MILILEKVLSIFLLLAVGFAAGKMNFLPDGTRNSLNNVLIKITAPCMIVSSITGKDVSDGTVRVTFEILIVSLFFFIFATLLGFLLSKYIFKVSPREDLGVYTYSFASLNSGFMGFPVTLALFGQDIFYLMVMQNVLLIIYLYTAGPMLLRLGSNADKTDISNTNAPNESRICASALMGKISHMFSTLCNPNTVACVISIFMLFCGLHLPEFIFESVEILGDATIPISMLAVGMQLAESDLLKNLKNRKLVIFSSVKMLLLPALTFIAVNWLPVDYTVKLCAVLASVFPVAVVTVPVTSMEGKNAEAVSSLVAVTTLMCIITIPIFAAFLTNFYLS